MYNTWCGRIFNGTNSTFLSNAFKYTVGYKTRNLSLSFIIGIEGEGESTIADFNRKKNRQLHLKYLPKNLWWGICLPRQKCIPSPADKSNSVPIKPFIYLDIVAKPWNQYKLRSFISLWVFYHWPVNRYFGDPQSKWSAPDVTIISSKATVPNLLFKYIIYFCCNQWRDIKFYG